jgi:hypothetical protein
MCCASKRAYSARHDAGAQQDADGLAFEEGGVLGGAGSGRQREHDAENHSSAKTNHSRFHGSPLAGSMIAVS